MRDAFIKSGFGASKNAQRADYAFLSTENQAARADEDSADDDDSAVGSKTLIGVLRASFSATRAVNRPRRMITTD